MIDAMDLVERYVAVWNEGNAAERRNRIRSLWTPDGSTCHRLLDARGYEPIEARVTASWDKWLRGGNYIFQPKHVACHHDVVKFDWVMVTVPGGDVASPGLSFLILNSDGQIQADYQFNPIVSEVDDLVDRYLTVWNEADADVRRAQVAELWAPDGAYISASSERHGQRAIEAQVREAHEAHVAKGLVFASARSHAHHNVVQFDWHMQAKDTGRAIAAGSHLLILDDRGRIRVDYQFDQSM